MFAFPEDDYTLLIPTFNRPSELAMLLRYLAHHRAHFRIVVLDASNERNQQRNAATIAELALTAEHRAFPPGLPFAETATIALGEITTPYCSLIPDDDLLLPGGLAAALDFLRRHGDYAGAQGYNAAFLPYRNGFRLLGIVEWCPSLDDERPLARLYRHARRYQPINWAVYRTAALRRSFAPTVGIDVDNLMMWELTHSFLAVREGKIARLPVLYRLRREERSVVPRRQLHVFHQFAAHPEKLMRDLARCRALLIEAYASGPDGSLGRQQIARIVALIEGHFFWRHFDAGTADFLIQKALGLLSAGELAAGEAALAAREPEPPDPAAVIDDTPTLSGDRRPVWIEKAMSEVLPSPEIAITPHDIRRLIADLAAYY